MESRNTGEGHSPTTQTWIMLGCAFNVTGVHRRTRVGSDKIPICTFLTIHLFLEANRFNTEDMAKRTLEHLELMSPHPLPRTHRDISVHNRIDSKRNERFCLQHCQRTISCIRSPCNSRNYKK